MVKAITFDLWNTLLWERDHDQVAVELAAAMAIELKTAGFSVKVDQLAEAMTRCRAMVMTRQIKDGLCLAPEQQFYWVLGNLNLTLSGEVAEQLLDIYTTARSGDKVEVMPGAIETLARLAETQRLALICNTGRTPGRVIRPWLEDKGLAQYLEVFTFSNELGIAKPNPRVFLHTLEQLGVEPEQAAHIGDDPRTDLKGARAVGMFPIWFNTKNRHDGPHWAYEVNSLEQLPRLVAELG